jgi:splicing suppressor protein 51
MSTNIMRRELIEKEEATSIPTFPLLAVRGHLCFRCLSHSAKLSKCGGCKRAMYCGKSCQTLDWKIQHNNHCKILQAVNEVDAQEEAESRSCSEWKRLLVSVKHYFLTTVFITASSIHTSVPRVFHQFVYLPL